MNGNDAAADAQDSSARLVDINVAAAPETIADALTTDQTAASPDSGTAVAVQDYNADKTREKIAIFLLLIMVGVIVALVLVSLIFSVNCWIRPETCAAANTALGILISSVSPVFTAMVGLVGSVVGFYFGSKQS